MTRRLTEATLRLLKADLLAACESEGVPAGPINSLDEVFADPQVVARGLQIAPDGIPGVRSPMTFSPSPRPKYSTGVRGCETPAFCSGCGGVNPPLLATGAGVPIPSR